MLSMMPDLLGQANQRQTTRRGWRCGGPRPGWQLNQAHDLCQTISRVCCTPRLSSSRSERTTGRSWCCNVTRALDASWNALSLGFGGAQFLHKASDNVLPMIARQWLFMQCWWHWDSNCPPSRRSSSFQRWSKPLRLDTHRRERCATPAILPGYFADDGQPAAPPFATVHHCERLLENFPSCMRNRLGTMLKVHPWVPLANESMKRQSAGIVHRREAPDKAERRRSALDWRRQGPRHRQSSGAQLAEGRGVRAGDMDFEKSDHESGGCAGGE